jgi:hypothetical protein
LQRRDVAFSIDVPLRVRPVGVLHVGRVIETRECRLRLLRVNGVASRMTSCISSRISYQATVESAPFFGRHLWSALISPIRAA